MSPTSIILNANNQAFVTQQSKQNAITKTKIINQALDLYRKYTLKKDLVKGFSQQTNEDVTEAMSDFEDYLKIIESNEIIKNIINFKI